MPIYEYQCSRCEHKLEAIQKIADDPLVECPSCGHPSLRKLISAASFRLKGGGWYETDFKTGNKKQLADSGSQGSKDGSTDGSKPAAKNTGSDKKSGDKGDKKASTKATTSTGKSESKSKSGSANNAGQ